MQKVSCPSCGAPVEFKSHASVMAVCGYCKSTLLKDADAVRDMGKMSAVLEDYSPLQVGTSGSFGGQEFSLVGRIQLRYAAGLWNEWYVLYGDGRAGWLSESGGQYTLTEEKEASGALPSFEQIRIGAPYNILGKVCTVADARTAQCTGGEGELPFRVGAGWQAKVADLRSGRSFVTLDYSEGPAPKVYAGQAVTLEQLKCQLLRDNDAVKDSAGKYTRKVQPLACPSCGGSLSWVPGVTRQIVCPSCRSQVDTSADVATVLAVGERMERFETTLKLGAKGNIGGGAYQVIGAMLRRDDEGEEWTEYQLYSPRGGFLWLIETAEGWQRSRLQDDWPVWNRGETIKVGDLTFRKLYEYEATVVAAVGAFNWQVRAGDTAQVVEFEAGKNRLAAERTEEELSWSWSTPVGADQLRAWFGLAIPDAVLAPKTDIMKVAEYFLYGVVGFNFIPLMFDFDETWHYSAFAAAAIWLPAKVISLMQD